MLLGRREACLMRNMRLRWGSPCRSAHIRGVYYLNMFTTVAFDAFTSRECAQHFFDASSAVDRLHPVNYFP